MTSRPTVRVHTRQVDGTNVNDIWVRWNSSNQECWTRAVGDSIIEEIAERVRVAVNGTAVVF